MVGVNMRKEIIVKTPSRLHIGLIDLNGSIGRIDGGLGLTLAKPNFTIRVSESDELRLDVPAQYQKQTLTAVNTIINYFKINDNFRITLEEFVPSHAGLGSGTQLSLGVGYAICKFKGISANIRDLVLLLGRGGTSGVGVTSFEKGGITLDGGHSFGGSGTKKCFTPTSASKGVPPPPILIHSDFPEEWKILLAIPDKCKKISGAHEAKLFEELCPIPLSEVKTISHIVLLKLLPALFEKNLQTFGSAIDDLQKYGWKKIEIDYQEPLILETMNYMRKEGAAGVGLSSWGPLIYAFGDDLETLRYKVENHLGDNGGGTCMIVHASNHGLVCQEV
jgi:beta-ribofuranosylaminobenzene 5'-phosphate synthase